MSNVIMKNPLESYIQQRLASLKENECDINTYRELKQLSSMINAGQFDTKVWTD